MLKVAVFNDMGIKKKGEKYITCHSIEVSLSPSVQT